MWTRPEVLSALALAVSTFSFATASLSLWRTRQLEQPVVWIGVEPGPRPAIWIVTLKVNNRSRFALTPVASDFYGKVAHKGVRRLAFVKMSTETSTMITGETFEGVHPEIDPGERVSMTFVVYRRPSSDHFIRLAFKFRVGNDRASLRSFKVKGRVRAAAYLM